MNRRVIVFVTVAVTLLTFLAATQTPTKATPAAAEQPCVSAATGVKGIVVAVSLRVRAKPGSNEAQVALLHANDVLTVLGRNSTGTWIYVQTTSGTAGWVGSPYVVLIAAKLESLPIVDTSSNASDVATQTASTGLQGIVVARVLTIRAKPAITEAQVGTLKADDVVTVLGRNETGTWVQIQTGGNVIGWVASPYIYLLKGKLNDLPVSDTTSNASATESAAATDTATVSATDTGTEVPTAVATSNCPSGTEAASTGVTLKGVVVAASLKIRVKPSSTAAEAGPQLKANDTVTVTGRNPTGTWLRVTTADGVTGWVGSPYIALTNGKLEDLPIVDSSSQ